MDCALHSVNAQPDVEAGFVAINYIDCQPHYQERFECLFCSRARAIDRLPGFIRMQVLKSHEEGRPYLVISEWDKEESFRAWVGSPEFLEGHKRGFEDIAEAKRRGETPPMTSDFVTYSVLTR
jgi:heme oxygenase (mycobilin-producing)